MIPPEKLKKHLLEKIYSYYIFLGEDLCLINKNQNMIINHAKTKGFMKISIINVEENKDWEKVLYFYKKRCLFFTKKTLIINFHIKKLSTILIEKINRISFSTNTDILTILKFNHLSLCIEMKKILNQFRKLSQIISCFTPYNLDFVNWIQYEIKEKNINIEKKSFFLLCKYYEGNTSFICKILDSLSKTTFKSYITVETIKKNIIDFFTFSVFHWIDAILQGQIKKSIYILSIFKKQQYSPLILIRSLQKDLLVLIYMTREKKINTNALLKKYNIFYKRYDFFMKARAKIRSKIYYEAIKILVEIEISIKKKYNNSIWIQLKKVTFILSASLI